MPPFDRVLSTFYPEQWKNNMAINIFMGLDEKIMEEGQQIKFGVPILQVGIECL